MTRRVIRLLIYLAILLTPVLGLPAVLEATGRSAFTAGRDLIAIKAAKDVLILLIFAMLTLDVVSGRKFLGDRFVWCLAGGIVISFCVSLFRSGPLLALIGLRGISPFVLIFVGHRYFDTRAVRRLMIVLGILLVIESGAAYVRAFHGFAIDGRTYFGLVARPSGSFLSPTSWSVLITFIACCILGRDISRHGRPRKRIWLVIAWCGLLVFMAAAGAGLFAFAALLGSYFLFLSKLHGRLKAAVLPLILVTPLVMMSHLVSITGRRGALNSVRSRVGILIDLASTMDIREIVIGKGLGVGSDVTITVRHLNPDLLDIDDIFYSDSLYAALFGQFGFVFVIVFLMFNLRLFITALRHRERGVNPIVILAIPAVLAGASGSVTTEVYPVNWLLFILYGVALKQQGQESLVQEADGQPCHMNLGPLESLT